MVLVKRKTWGELNPVTRKSENSKAYNRRKTQDWKRELPPNPVFCFIYMFIQLRDVPSWT